MTVEELIKELQQYNSNKKVFGYNEYGVTTLISGLFINEDEELTMEFE